MHSLRVGHFTNEAQGTGATVFLFEQPAVGAYWLCGSSPASCELDTLALGAFVTHINGLVLTGGSAFGLGATTGVMRWLSEQGWGWSVPHGIVPIVPGAAIYDLAVKTPVFPTTEDLYQACCAAKVNNAQSGRIGAGTGASVGKLVAGAARMSGGIGRAEMTLPNGVSVLVYAVVNCVGDVRDVAGKIVAGARLANGGFADCQQTLLNGQDLEDIGPANTTLVAIFTDAALPKNALQRIAKMATAGMGRAIAPVFTVYDGDLVFAVSLGNKSASELVLGTVAAELTRQAIVAAVKDSVVID